MKLSIGIIGLPNVGKSTLFNILTKQHVNAANYPFATIDPNIGVVPVPDERLDRLAEMSKSKEKIPAVVEFYDIAGLVRGAHEGKGLGNQFLARIREVNAVLHVVRVFKDDDVVHVDGSVDPMRDIQTVTEELKAKDESSEETENLLSAKPQLILFNGTRSDIEAVSEDRLHSPYITVDLGTADAVPEVVQKAYEILGLISFFTTGEKETRAWTVKRGSTAPEAAGVIHSDFEKRFIRAEIIGWQELLNAESWKKARESGKIRVEGKDYIVQDGDVIYFRTDA